MSKDCQLSMSNSFPGSQLSAGGSGSANRGQMPRKGILKQSASANQLQTGDGVEKDRSRSVSPKLVDSTAAVDHENKQYNDNLPQPAVRQSKKSKIPKLSVTWWETTAPYPEDPDEQELPAKETANTSSPLITMDDDDDDDDDNDDDDRDEKQLDRTMEQQQELTTENKSETATDLKPWNEPNSSSSSVGFLDGRSSCCSSNYGSAVSQWWQGRSTRYVLHCEKRGCNHAHHHGDEEYMTPTQRKNREIALLKQQIRHLEWKLEDKESHLGQLRERLSELEAIMDRGGLLSENHRLLNKLNRIREEHQQEKKALCERFEQELTKVCNFYEKERADLRDTYQFEMDELRSTMVDDDDDDRHMQRVGNEKPTKSTTMENCETSKVKLKIASFLDNAWDSGISHSVSRVDTATMTEEEAIDQQQQQQQQQQLLQQQSLYDELQAYHSECIFLHNCVVELQQQLRQREQGASSSTTPSGLEPNNSDDCCAPTTSNSGYTAIDAQIQAYKTECMIWRMKASELEIALKEQTPSRCRLEDRNATLQAENDDLRRALDAIKAEVKLMQTGSSESTSEQVEMQKAEKELRAEEVKTAAPAPAPPQPTLPLAQMEENLVQTRETAEKQLKDGVADRLEKVEQEKRQLETELALLRMQHEDQTKEVADLEEKLKLKDELTTILEKQLMNKQGEYETVQLTLMNVRENGDRVSAKATRLEQRVAELEAILDQCGVIVRSSNSSRSTEKKLPPDCHSLARCRETQTDRSFFEQEKALAELAGLNDQYERLKHQHAEQSRTAQQQLADLADTLKAKNGLVNNLTSQMQTLCEELEALRQSFERERQSYRQQLADQATALERVPLLERELCLARDELRRADEQADADRDRLHRAIEDSLTENLKIQNDTVAYWKQKLHNVQIEADAYKKQLEKKQTELQDLSVRLNLEKVGLAQQVNLSLSEVAEFQKRFNVPTADQKIMVRPVQVDREIDNAKRMSDWTGQVDRMQFCSDTSTWIDKQLLLTDEKEEQQLRLLQGELNATRAQVEVLQTKLITAEQRRQDADDLRDQYKKAQEQIEDLQQELSVSKAEQKINEQNFQIKSQAWESERAKLVRDENERFLQLEKEFEKVREELKLMIDKHELEKADLLAKLHKEAAGDGLQSPAVSSARQTISPPPTVGGHRSPSTVPPEPEPQLQCVLTNSTSAQLDLFNWLKDVISGEGDSTMLASQQPDVVNKLNDSLKENEQLKQQLQAQTKLLANITAELSLYKAEESETVRRLEEPQPCKHLSCFDLNHLVDETERCVQQKQTVAWRRMLSQTCRQLIQLEQKLNKLETDRARIRYELDTLKGEYEMVTLSKDPQQQHEQEHKATTRSKERRDQQLKLSTVSQESSRKAETTTREYKPSVSFQRWPTNTDNVRVADESCCPTSDTVISKQQQQQQQSAARVGELQQQVKQYYSQQCEQPPKKLTNPTDQLLTISNTEAIQLQTAELKSRDDDRKIDSWKEQQFEQPESNAAQVSQEQSCGVDYLTQETTSTPISTPPHGSQERQPPPPPQQQQPQLSTKQRSSSPSTFSSRFRQSLSISERSSSTKFESSSSAKFTSANRSPTPKRMSNVITVAAADRSTGRGGQSKLSRHESLEAVTTTACSETETDLMTQSFTISQDSELFPRLGENQAPAESLPFFSCNNLLTLCNNDTEELRQLLDLERQRFKWVEEKAAQLEKETSMLNYELNMLYQRQQRERKLLKEDNERLREQLNSMVNRLQAAAAKDPRCTCDRQRQTTRTGKTRSASTSAVRDPSLEMSHRSRHNSSQDAAGESQQSRRHHRHHHHYYHCSKQRPSTVVTEQEAALRFLRDSFYFYLIDREANDHLTAIMNILNFTNEQRARVLDRRGMSKL